MKVTDNEEDCSSSTKSPNVRKYLRQTPTMTPSNDDIFGNPSGIPSSAKSANMLQYLRETPALTPSKDNIFGYPFGIPSFLHEIDEDKFGSVTKDIKALFAKKMHMINSCARSKPTVATICLDEEGDHSVSRKPLDSIKQIGSKQNVVKDLVTHVTNQEIVNLDDECCENRVSTISIPILIIDSDDENDGDERPSQLYHNDAFEQPSLSSNSVPTHNVVRAKEVSDCARKRTAPEKKPESSYELGHEVKKKCCVNLGSNNDEASEESRYQTDATDVADASLPDIAIDEIVALVDGYQKCGAADVGLVKTCADDVITCARTSFKPDSHDVTNVWVDMEKVNADNNHQMGAKDNDMDKYGYNPRVNAGNDTNNDHDVVSHRMNAEDDTNNDHDVVSPRMNAEKHNTNNDHDVVNPRVDAQHDTIIGHDAVNHCMDAEHDTNIGHYVVNPRINTEHDTNIGLNVVSPCMDAENATNIVHDVVSSRMVVEHDTNIGCDVVKPRTGAELDTNNDHDVVNPRIDDEHDISIGHDAVSLPMNAEHNPNNGRDVVNARVSTSIAVVGDDSYMDAEHDGLADLWNEMSFAMECSKNTCEDPFDGKQMEQDKEGCDHSFILKDDLGSVCRVCGVIDKSIETIFEFVYNKGRRTTRTYRKESRKPSHEDSTVIFSEGVNSPPTTKISVHPRHGNQMRPHQVEGFHFLCSNLVTDMPGGCILAHAPGSGKTFMIISFIQSYMAKYPEARPLIVLPKGILETWKSEFKTWQVEDIPLHDFYSSKAETRSQQLNILKQWVGQKSVLFLGYNQLSVIFRYKGDNKVEADCQEMLIKVPSMLIIDEGHTPRNDDTDVFQSLERIQTPRKVVLSGTLYQNHVKEVFNILNLVRPKFLKLSTSREIVARIMSRVNMSGVRKNVKARKDLDFELVEQTLQDTDYTRKITVIQDLRELTNKVLHYYKGDFLDELPGFFDFTVVLNLSGKQKDEVKKLRKLDKFKQISVGSALYVHPQLKTISEKHPTGSFGTERKIDEMLEKIEVREGVKLKFFLNILNLCESSGEKLLVFSQYLLPLKALERISVKLKGWSPGKELFTITGDSSNELRERYMERFNNASDAKVLFGSIKACGEGISLVGASRVIILDVHLNPSVTRQAIGRAFRPGQKRKVYVYRLIASDSPEEKDYSTCYRKEFISKMWFEWNENNGQQNSEVKSVDINECGDLFFESPMLREDVKVLYKR